MSQSMFADAVQAPSQLAVQLASHVGGVLVQLASQSVAHAASQALEQSPVAQAAMQLP